MRERHPFFLILSRRALAALLLCLCGASLHAGVATGWTGAGAAGDWSDAANWNNGAPTNDGQVLFNVPATITNVPATFAGQIQITSTVAVSLTLLGNVTLAEASPSIDIPDDATLTFVGTGAETLATGAFAVNIGNNGALEFSGVNATFTGSTVNSDGFIRSVGGNGPLLFVFTPGQTIGDFEHNATTGVTFSTSVEITNLTLNSVNQITCDQSLTVTSALIDNTGSLITANNAGQAVNVKGDIVVTAGSGNLLSSTNGAVNFNGTGPQSIELNGRVIDADAIIGNENSGGVTFMDAAEFTGDLTVADNAVAVFLDDLTAATLIIEGNMDATAPAGGSLTVNADVTITDLQPQGILIANGDRPLGDIGNCGPDTLFTFNGAVEINDTATIDLGGGRMVFANTLLVGDTGNAETINANLTNGTFTFNRDITIGDDGGGADTVTLNVSVAAFSPTTSPLSIDAGTNTVIGGVTFDEATIADGATLTFSGAAFAAPVSVGDLTLGNGSTLDSDVVGVEISGSILATGASATVAAATGATMTLDSGANQTIRATALTVNGDVVVTGAGTVYEVDQVSAGNPSTVAFTGDVTVNGGAAFGCAEPAGAEVSGTLTSAGTFRVDVSSGFLIGDGVFRFAGNLDLGGTANVDMVIAIPTDDDSNSELHLTGGAQTVAFSAGGSFFALESIAAATEVTQTGKMILVGDLPLAASDGGVSGMVWTGGAGSMQVGSDQFGNSDSGSEEPVEITIGDGNAVFGAVVAVQVTNGGPDSYNGVLFTTSTGGAGAYTLASLSIEGDSDDTDGGAMNETNAPVVTFRNSVVSFTGVVEVEDGTQIAPGDDGKGGSLIFDNCGASFGGNVTVGLGNALAAGSAASLTADADGQKTWTFADGVTLTVANFSDLSLEDIATTAATGDSYTITVGADAGNVILEDVSLSATDSGALTLTLGGANLRVSNCAFSRYDAAGVQIAAGTILGALNGSTFANGLPGGAHLNFLGHSNAGGLARINADGNTFDGSTSGGTIISDAGTIVRVADGADDVAITFRHSNFGAGGFSLSAAQAEDDDNDGDNANGVGGDDVTWEDVETLTFAIAGTTPTSALAATPTGGSTQTTFLLFTLTAAGSAASEVNALTVRFDVSGLTAGGISTGADSVTLFNDSLGIVSGVMEAGEIIAQDDAANIAGGQLSFAGLSETITVGMPQTWGIAFLTAGDTAGTIELAIETGDVTLGGAGLVLGLPIDGDVAVTVPFADLSVTGVNSVNAAPQTSASVNAEPVLFAVTITNAGNADATMTGITLQLALDWRNTKVFDPNDAFDAISAYVDGSATGASDGNNLFKVESDTLLGSVTSASLAIGAGDGLGSADNAVISVPITFTTNLVIPAGDEKTLFAVIEVTASSVQLVAAKTQALDARLSLQTWTVTPNITTTDGNDLLNSPAAAITGKLLIYRGGVSNIGGGGCALAGSPYDGGKLSELWLCALVGIAVVVARRRVIRSKDYAASSAGRIGSS